MATATKTAVKRVKKLALTRPHEKNPYAYDFGYAAVVDVDRSRSRYNTDEVNLGQHWGQWEAKAATDDRQWIVVQFGRGDYRVAYRTEVLASFEDEDYDFSKSSRGRKVKRTVTIRSRVHDSMQFLVLDEHVYRVVGNHLPRLEKAIAKAEELIAALAGRNPFALQVSAEEFGIAYDKAQVVIEDSKKYAQTRHGQYWRGYWNLPVSTYNSRNADVVAALVDGITASTGLPRDLVILGLEENTLTLVGERPAETLVTVVVRRDDKLREFEAAVPETQAVTGNEVPNLGTIVHVGSLVERLQNRLNQQAAGHAESAFEARERLVKSLQNLRDRAQADLDLLAQGDVWRLGAFDRLGYGNDIEDANVNYGVLRQALQSGGDLLGHDILVRIREGKIENKYDLREEMGLDRH